MSPVAARMAHVDALKAIACQLIVLHHLAFYGPMVDHVEHWAPSLFEALSRHARMAVQVFLVVAGFLAATRLQPQLPMPARATTLLRERYLRLVLPLAVMLVLAIVAAAVARQWMGHPSVPSAPGALQLLAHLLLLQDLLGVEALSAGVWYVAIDFQLHALLVAVLAVSTALQRRARLEASPAPAIVAVLVAASLFGFNRDADWDVAAPYFFGAYGLGVLAAWWTAPRARPGALLVLALLVALAWWVEFRGRLAIASGVAALLVWRAMRPASPAAAAPSAAARLLCWLSDISFAVFLVHFPVCLVVNAAFEAFVPHAPVAQALGLLLAWGASLAAGAVFHRHVERPLLAWSRRRGTQQVARSRSLGAR